jgi:predicted enzyme related to lactoylglutathione lyase
MKRVTGIGGIFFKSENRSQLFDWYKKHLGIQRESYGQGASFHWRGPQAADGSEPGAKALTAWCIFRQTTKYAASKASFMINYRVDNLDSLPEELKKSGIEIDPQREDYGYGRFAWITDPDGNRIELREPPKPKQD